MHGTVQPWVVKPEIPGKAVSIFKPAPYKVIYGGRGKSASWDFAQAAIILGMNRKLFIVCGREIQRSIKESVHKLLSDRIEALGLALRFDPELGRMKGFYKIQDNEIEGVNGTRIVFMGVRNNILALKSTEGIDIFWLTEATTVPNTHWEIILPTVRRDPPHGPFGQGSEIWVDLNPELSSDDSYQRWVVDPPAGALVIEMNWRDNPWFPEILRRQKDEMKEKDYDSYLTVWEGKTRKAVAGSIFSKELHEGILAGRISPHIKADMSRGTIFTFDLGRADICAWWAWQQIGTEHNAVDYYANVGHDIPHYLEEIQKRGYKVAGIWLPHDAKQFHQSAKKSIDAQCRDVFKTPGIVKTPKSSTRMPIRLSYTRALFPRVNINDATCADGMLSLQHYQFGVHPQTKQRTKDPLHNWASHGASAFIEYAVALREGLEQEKAEDLGVTNVSAEPHPQGWMN